VSLKTPQHSVDQQACFYARGVDRFAFGSRAGSLRSAGEEVTCRSAPTLRGCSSIFVGEGRGRALR
jgi:hypothetical protein